MSTNESFESAMRRAEGIALNNSLSQITLDNTQEAQVGDHNAVTLNDKYRVQDTDGLVFYMEHNPAEAIALAKWLTHQGGRRFRVFRMHKSTVDKAKKIRPVVVRHQQREEAFKDMGVV